MCDGIEMPVKVGDKVRFDPLHYITGNGAVDLRSKVTGNVVMVNVKHRMFLAVYGEAEKKISFNFADLGVTVWKVKKMSKYHSEDITFCISSCSRTSCFRHKNNIRDTNREHTVADLKGTVYCQLPPAPAPYRKRGRKARR